MQKHTKTYLTYFSYGSDDVILCEVCSARAVDVHHIKYRSQGGKDSIENVMALCRDCHDKAHSETLKGTYLQAIHNQFLEL